MSTGHNTAGDNTTGNNTAGDNATGNNTTGDCSALKTPVKTSHGTKDDDNKQSDSDSE